MEITERLIVEKMHEGYIKCRKCLNSSKDEMQMDSAVNACNAYAQMLVCLINRADFQFVTKFANIHKRWCKQRFNELSAILQSLDAEVTVLRDRMQNQISGRSVGF